MHTKITKRIIERTPTPPKGDLFIRDTQLKGFGVRIMILPSNEGHPVKRLTFATEVDHDKTINREKAGKETAHAGI